MHSCRENSDSLRHHRHRPPGRLAAGGIPLRQRVGQDRQDAQAREKVKALDEKNEALGKDILNRYKKRLMEHHVPEEKIFLLNRKRPQSAVFTKR
jgi:hypothetical protein